MAKQRATHSQRARGLQLLSRKAASHTPASTASLAILLLFLCLHISQSTQLPPCLKSEQAVPYPTSTVGTQLVQDAKESVAGTGLSSQYILEQQSAIATPHKHYIRPGAVVGTSRGSRSLSGADRGLEQASPAPQQLIIDDLSCPQWLKEYKDFHKQNRAAPGAKYLVYTARHGSSGLGDRIRAMMFVTRLAYATNRVVLFTWNNDPVEPQLYLPSAGYIDWTLSGIPYDPDKAKQIVGYDWMQHGNSEFDQMTHGGLHNDSTQFVSVQTSREIHTDCLGCPEVKQIPPGSHPHVCLFHFLFKPSDHLNSIAGEKLVKLYGPQALESGFKYVAGHMRLAGMPSEQQLLPHGNRGLGKGPLLDLIATVKLSKDAAMQQGINITDTPVLMLVDSHIVRETILSGHLTHVITTDTKPVHLARYRKGAAGREKEQHLKGVHAAYVDLLLLARARCLVAGQSGFSYAAWMLAKGYGGCFTFIHQLPKHPPNKRLAD